MWPLRDPIKDEILRCGGKIANDRGPNTFKVGPYYVYVNSVPEDCFYYLMKLDTDWMWDNVGDFSIDDMARIVSESVDPRKKKKKTIPKGMILQRSIYAFTDDEEDNEEQMLFGENVPVRRPTERKKKQEKGKLKTLDAIFGEEYVPPPKGTKTLRQIFGDEVAPIDRGKYFVEEETEPERGKEPEKRVSDKDFTLDEFKVVIEMIGVNSKDSFIKFASQFGEWIRNNTYGMSGVRTLYDDSLYYDVNTLLKTLIKYYFGLRDLSDDEINEKYSFRRFKIGDEIVSGSYREQYETKISNFSSLLFDIASNGWDLGEALSEWEIVEKHREGEKEPKRYNPEAYYINVLDAIEGLPKSRKVSVQMARRGRVWMTVEDIEHDLANGSLDPEDIISIDESDFQSEKQYYSKYKEKKMEEPKKPTVADEVAEKTWDSIWDRSETPDLFDTDEGDYVFERSKETYQIIKVEREGRVPAMYVYHLKHAYPNDDRVGFERVKGGKDLQRYFKVLPQDVIDYLGNNLVDFVNGGNRKELWELTMDEFVGLLREYNEGAYNLSDEQIMNIGKTLRDSGLKAYEYSPSLTTDSDFYYIRKRVVEKALKEGKPVPSEVLKDYPDLAEEYEKKEPEEKLIGGYKAGDVEFGMYVKSDWVPPVEEKKDKDEGTCFKYVAKGDEVPGLDAKISEVLDLNFVDVRKHSNYKLLKKEGKYRCIIGIYLLDSLFPVDPPYMETYFENPPTMEEIKEEVVRAYEDILYNMDTGEEEYDEDVYNHIKRLLGKSEDMGEWGDKKRAVLEEIKKDVIEKEPENKIISVVPVRTKEGWKLKYVRPPEEGMEYVGAWEYSPFGGGTEHRIDDIFNTYLDAMKYADRRGFEVCRGLCDTEPIGDEDYCIFPIGSDAFIREPMPIYDWEDFGDSFSVMGRFGYGYFDKERHRIAYCKNGSPPNDIHDKHRVMAVQNDDGTWKLKYAFGGGDYVKSDEYDLRSGSFKPSDLVFDTYDDLIEYVVNHDGLLLCKEELVNGVYRCPAYETALKEKEKLIEDYRKNKFEPEKEEFEIGDRICVEMDGPKGKKSVMCGVVANKSNASGGYRYMIYDDEGRDHIVYDYKNRIYSWADYLAIKESEPEPTNEDIVKCAKSLVIEKFKEAGIPIDDIRVVGSRSYAETSDMPRRNSDVDVVVYLRHTDPNKKGTDVIKDVWNKLGLSIHTTHPWECYGVKIDLIPDFLPTMSPIEEELEPDINPEPEIPQGKRVDFNGGYAVEMPDLKKIYIHFDTIPSAEVRGFLKSRRWWWNRRDKVWQKFISDYAWNSVEDMIDRFYGGTGEAQEESGSPILPTVEEIPVAPSVQPSESSYNPNMGLEIWNYPLRPDQEEAVQKALSVNRGLVVAPTGAGKTIIFMDVLRRLEPHKVVILFPKIALLKQMEERFIRDHKIPPSAIGHYYSNEKDLNKPIVLTTYASAKQNPKMILGDADVVVFDEVHNILGDVAVQNIIGYLRDTDKRVYGFTATPPEGADVLYDFLPLVYESSFSNMREAGNISESMLYMVPLDMSEETKREYEKISEKIDKLKKALVKRLGYLPDFKDMNRMVKSARVKGDTKAIMLALINAYQDRIGILSNDVNKVVGVMEVANHLRRDVGYRGPIMLFTDRVDTLKRLCRELNSTAGIGCEYITGETKSKDRENILKRWAKGDFPILGSINVLAEGIDVPKAKAGIFVGNPGGPTKIVQKAGRLLRKTESGEPARIYMLYLKDTPEIKYVEKMSDKLDVAVDTLDVNV